MVRVSKFVFLTTWLHKEGCVKFLTEVVSVLGIKVKERSILCGGMEVELVDMPQGSSLLEERFDLKQLAGLCQRQMWGRELWVMGRNQERHSGRERQDIFSEVGRE